MTCPDFNPSNPVIRFTHKRKVQTARAWYMDGTKLYVNWGGEPMQVTPVGVAGGLSAAEQDEVEEHRGGGVKKPSTEAAWLLAVRGLIVIKIGRYGPYSEAVATSGSGARSTADTRRASYRGSAPRHARNAEHQSGVGSVRSTTGIPPSLPLKQGAKAGVAQLAEPLPSKQDVAGSSPAARSKLTPNAVRVVTKTRATYYPVAMYESIKGRKDLVLTTNKIYRSCSLAASAGDVVVLP